MFTCKSEPTLPLTLAVPSVGVRSAAQQTSHGLSVILSQSQEQRRPAPPVCPGGVCSSLQQGGETANTFLPAENTEVETSQSRVVSSIQLRIVLEEQLQELQVSSLGRQVETRLTLVVSQTHKISASE